METNKKLVLTRLRDDGTSTLGYLTGYVGERDLLNIHSLEPTWLNNIRNISCIPDGAYIVKPRTSPKFGKCLIVEPVENRDNILLHAGNFYKNTEGCILPGMKFTWLDGDNKLDVSDSKEALDLLLEFVPEDGCELLVKRAHAFQTPWK